MNIIIIAVLSVTVTGAVCAVILTAASNVMAVKVDEREALILESLPGSNCGACGYPGCAGYAVVLVSDKNIRKNLCIPGGAETAKRLSDILGVAAEDVAEKAAVVHCCGDCDSQQKKMEYTGIKTCIAAKSMYGGEGACSYGCMGYGDCKTVCPSDAVCIENGIARINPNNCTGCGLCVKSCPNKLIAIKNIPAENAEAAVVILCKNTEKGAAVRKKCSNGCIACGKCVRECPSAAITIEDNLAKIDYEKCTDCGHCAEICVTHCIQLMAVKNQKT